MTTSTAANVTGQEKEKVEKRRALGRGLESLLPGPRVVKPTPAGPPAPPVAAGAEQGSRAGTSAAPQEPGLVIHAAVEDSADAELRSAGQPGAAVPTQTSEESITLMAAGEPGRIPANLVVNLAIADIDKNPFQTRYVEDDDALEELSESIKANGVVQPIMVRPAADEGRYTLILGERRLHASKKAGLSTIPAMVRRVSDQQAAEMTIIENLQREDLSPLEHAQSFKILSQQFQMTQAEIGERVGLTRTSIANYMRLLKLPRDVMQLLAEKKLSFEKAKALLSLGDDHQIQVAALQAVKHGMNIEQIETMVLTMSTNMAAFGGEQAERKPSGARWVDPNVRAAQTDLERLLGVRVRIRDRKGKGKIVIEYATVDDYDRVVGMLRGK
jgi:ParB family chromosome partitioning protein